MKNKVRFSLVLMSFAFVAITGCSNPSKPSSESQLVTTDSVADDNSLGYQGHITTRKIPMPSESNKGQVPTIVATRPYIPPPKPEPKVKTFTLTAIDAPVHELLYRLGEMAKYQVDIWQGVEGFVTINALNQPIDQILTRISDQLDLIVQVEDKVIQVRPDKPVWRDYRVDYVNIKRSSNDSIVMNMTVGGSVNPAAGGGSRSSVEKSSVHDFWNTLRNNLLAMLGTQNTAASASVPAATPASAMESSVPAVTPLPQTAAPVANQQRTVPVVTNPEAGLVMVYATEKRHQDIARYLKSITQRSERQVMIEASVVEVVLSDKHQSGIDWSNSGFQNLASRTAPIGENLFTATLGRNIGVDFSFGLRMLEEFGEVQVLSSPKIMAVNNQSALLKVVDNEVYFTIEVSRSTSTAGTDVTYSTTVHTVPVGFMMSMTPFVNDEREISINIRPTISRIIGNVKDPNPDLKTAGVESLIPIVQEREMETVLKLRDQQTAVIGGLIEDREDRRNASIPWFGRLPILGKSVFGYKENATTKTELVIFIRPIIIDKPDVDNGDLQSFRGLLEKHAEASP